MVELRILVVEDDAVARHLLVSLLETDGYVLLGVEDGPAALAAAREFKPTLVFSTGTCPVRARRRGPSPAPVQRSAHHLRDRG